MKASIAFIFFMLFLAGIAFVNLRGMQEQSVPKHISDAILTEASWRPVKLNEMQVPSDTLMNTRFGEDLQVTGHGGCNRYFGSYELDGDALQIGPLGATRMACPEPAASMEIAFFEALQSVTVAAIKNGFLVMSDEAGNVVLQMQAVAHVD